MKLMAERRTRLSVAVTVADGGPARQVPAEELQLRLPGARLRPLTHRAGYWLLMDAKAGAQTLSWTSTHHVDGQLSVQIDPSQPRATVVELALVAPPPVSFAQVSLPRARLGRSYLQVLALKGGKAPFAFTASGLPPGLYLRSGSGTLEGTPVRRGAFDVELAVSDVNGTQARLSCRLTVTA